MVRLAGGLCVANLHAGTGRSAEADVLRSAGIVSAWAGEAPLVLGGDFNVRPGRSGIFDRLADEYGLIGATAPEAIDHLLVRKVTVLEPTTAWRPGRRDVPDAGSDHLVRLSDHAPVSARISV